MNIGSEEARATTWPRRRTPCSTPVRCKDQFIGNIEGRDINRGAADVIVSDGFVGNVVLKISEGVFEFVMKMACQGSRSSRSTSRRRKAQQALQNLVDRYDYSDIRRRAAAGHRRHLHHLPRQLRRPGHQERPGRRRPVCPRPSSTN